jgi:hypothetical protein
LGANRPQYKYDCVCRINVSVSRHELVEANRIWDYVQTIRRHETVVSVVSLDALRQLATA